MGILSELYKAPDYIDPEHGGMNRPNRGNEGALLSKGENRKYGGGMTGSSWADESHHPDDPANPRNGPAGAISTDDKLETGGGFRSPGGEDPRKATVVRLTALLKANSINPKGNVVPASDTQATATRPYAAGSGEEDWDAAYAGYLRKRADLTVPPMDKIKWVEQEKEIHTDPEGGYIGYLSHRKDKQQPALNKRDWDVQEANIESVAGESGNY